MKKNQVSKYPDTWVWIFGYWYYPIIQCLDKWIVGYLIFYVSRYLDTWILGYHGYLDTRILGYFNFFRIWIMDSQKSLNIQVSGYHIPSRKRSLFFKVTLWDSVKYNLYENLPENQYSKICHKSLGKTESYYTGFFSF